MKGVAASPIDTAKPETPDETRWSLKASISCETSPNLYMCHLKIDVSYEVSAKCQAIPRNLHFVTTSRSLKIRNTARLKHIPCHENAAGYVQRVAPATKNATHLLQLLQKHCACHGRRFSHYQTRRARLHATRNEATCRLKPPKMTPSAELLQSSCGRLRTAADGCRGLGTAQRTPRPPE